MNMFSQVRGMMSAFHPSQVPGGDYGSLFMDMDIEVEDQLAMMEAMGDEGPKIKLVDGDFYNGIVFPFAL